MKKVIGLLLAAAILILASSLPSQADWHGGHGGGHFRGGIWIGPGWWGPPYYPYYPYYYPYYSEPPVIIERQAPVYVQPNQRQEEQDYWYYCTKPEGYYPYIKRCPSGWLKVLPAPPTDRETRDDGGSSQHDRPPKDTPPAAPNKERY